MRAAGRRGADSAGGMGVLLALPLVGTKKLLRAHVWMRSARANFRTRALQGGGAGEARAKLGMHARIERRHVRTCGWVGSSAGRRCCRAVDRGAGGIGMPRHRHTHLRACCCPFREPVAVPHSR